MWIAGVDKVRPVVILSREPLGAVLQAVIAAPVTSRIRGLSTEVPLGAADGVRIASVANLDGMQLIKRESLLRRVGKLSKSTMQEICEASAIAVGCD